MQGTWLFMSRALLLNHQNSVRQSIKDDMESLLYVVLYCALHWLPHDLDKDTLADVIAAFFERRDAFRTSSIGGAAKIANAEDRHYTGGLVFGSAAFKEWLDTVMDYMAPTPDKEDSYKDKWCPEQLDVFWSNFLKTRKLEANDRVHHDVRRPSLPLEASTSESSPSLEVRPSPTSVPADTKRAGSTRSTPSQLEPAPGVQAVRVTRQSTKRTRNTRSTDSQPEPVPGPEVQPMRVTRQSTKRRHSSPAPIPAATKRTRSTRPRSGLSEDGSLRRSTRTRAPTARDAATDRQASVAQPAARGSARRGRGRGATAVRARSASTSRGRGGRGTAAAASGRGDGTGNRGAARGRSRGRGERKTVLVS